MWPCKLRSHTIFFASGQVGDPINKLRKILRMVIDNHVKYGYN